MKKLSVMARLAALLVLTLIVSSCVLHTEDTSEIVSEALTKPGTSLPDQPIYVLANFRQRDESPFPNELYVVDADTWEIWNKTPLHPNAVWNFAQDPMGRIWVGYGGGVGYIDNRVEVYDAKGEQIKTLKPCNDPFQPIAFSDRSALIPCNESGFYASVASVDLETLKVTHTQDIKIEGHNFLINAVGGNGKTALLWGGSHLALVDIDTSEIKALIRTTTLSPRDVAAGEDRFYLPNVASITTEYGDFADLDILLLTQPPSLIGHDLPQPAPLWTLLHENNLYSYHNPHEFTFDPLLEERYITRLNIETGETQEWQLPDRWRADDIAWFDGKILLTHMASADEPEKDGVYAFDLQTGELTQLIQIPNATRIIVPK